MISGFEEHKFPWSMNVEALPMPGAIVSHNAFKGGKRALLRQQMQEFRQFTMATAMVLDEAGEAGRAHEVNMAVEANLTTNNAWAASHFCLDNQTGTR